MYDVKLVLDSVVNALYEGSGIYNLMNRSFDGLVRDARASSVDFPRNPTLVASKVAVAGGSGSRKKAKGDTDAVNAPFNVYTVPVTEEHEASFVNPKLIQNFVNQATDVMGDAIDTDVLIECVDSIPADQKLERTGDVLKRADLSAIDAAMNGLNLPKRGRLVVVPYVMQEEFQEIDIIKTAQGFNKDLLEKGVAIINNTMYVCTGLAPQVDSTDVLIGISCPLVAVVIKNMLERKSRYDETLRADIIDYNSYVAMKKLRSEAVVVLA